MPSDIRENEQVHIWNIDNGERLVTYASAPRAGSGIVSHLQVAGASTAAFTWDNRPEQH